MLNCMVLTNERFRMRTTPDKQRKQRESAGLAAVLFARIPPQSRFSAEHKRAAADNFMEKQRKQQQWLILQDPNATALTLVPLSALLRTIEARKGVGDEADV